MALTVAALALATGCGAHPPTGAASRPPTSSPTSASHGPTRLVATVEPWRLPFPVSRSVAFPAGNDIRLAGGLLDHDVSTADVLLVNLQDGTVRSDGTLAQPVHDAGGMALAGADLVVGGGASVGSAVVQQLAGGAYTATDVGALPGPRSDATAADTGAVGYLVGGYDGSALPPSILMTSNGRTFTLFATLIVPVRYAAVAIADGALWVVGGRTTVDGSVQTDEIQRVSLTNGAVSVVARLPQPRSDAAAIVLDGHILICGGDIGATAVASVLSLDPATGRVQQVAELPGPVADAAAVVANDRGYLLGGEAATRLDTVMELHYSAS